MTPVLVALVSSCIGFAAGYYARFDVRRREARGAARIWRQDFYAMQIELKIARALGRWSGPKDRFWTTHGTVEMLAVVAGATKKEADWVAISHAHQDLMWTLTKWEGGEDHLWEGDEWQTVYDCLENGRKSIAELERTFLTQWTFEPHPSEQELTSWPL